MTRILIVDDEENLVDLIRGYLEGEGFSGPINLTWSG
jgi:CheY-like chemotaxis protein